MQEEKIHVRKNWAEAEEICQTRMQVESRVSKREIRKAE